MTLSVICCLPREYKYVLILQGILLLTACSGKPLLSSLSTNARIVAFGDSLTYGTGVSSEQSYPSVLQSLIGRTVIRSGVPGEISNKGLARLDSVLAREQPDLVIVCHGGNDILRRMNGAQTEANLRAMVSKVRTSGAEVILLAVPRLGLFPEAPGYYERIAEDMQVPIEMDVLADLEGDSSMKSDQVHFNAAGYRKMALAVQQLLIDAGAI
ncbi:MAG: GDSL-type esterase/lipase family protein [Pseudomonadales bacterium]|nr:GDSL-type esterase/lipase family protein [Pseudomonadales bacterium]